MGGLFVEWGCDHFPNSPQAWKDPEVLFPRTVSFTQKHDGVQTAGVAEASSNLILPQSSSTFSGSQDVPPWNSGFGRYQTIVFHTFYLYLQSSVLCCLKLRTKASNLGAELVGWGLNTWPSHGCATPSAHGKEQQGSLAVVNVLCCTLYLWFPKNPRAATTNSCVEMAIVRPSPTVWPGCSSEACFSNLGSRALAFASCHLLLFTVALSSLPPPTIPSTSQQWHAFPWYWEILRRSHSPLSMAAPSGACLQISV